MPPTPNTDDADDDRPTLDCVYEMCVTNARLISELFRRFERLDDDERLTA